MKTTRIFEKNLFLSLKVALMSSALSLLLTGNAVALELKASEIRGNSQKKPVSVLQNRYFIKTLRPEVGLLAGSVLDEAYTDTNLSGVRIGLFGNEWIGAEFQYMQSSIKDTADRKALNELEYRPLDPSKQNQIVSPDPEVNKIYRVMDVNTVVAPFYGKLNLFDKMIVYTDIYGTLGLAQVDTDQGKLTAYTLGVGERFYLFESWSLRIDFRDRIYTEKRGGRDSRKNALSIDFGASYFFL